MPDKPQIPTTTSGAKADHKHFKIAVGASRRNVRETAGSKPTKKPTCSDGASMGI